VAEASFEAGKALVPFTADFGDPAHDVIEALGPERITHFPTGARSFDQPCFVEGSQVFADCLTGNGKVACQLRSGGWVVADPAQYLPTGGIGEGGEYVHQPYTGGIITIS